MTTYTFNTLKRFGFVVQSRVERVVSRIGLEVFAGVVKRSPVDTGRFRASWQYSEGKDAPDASSVPPQDRKVFGKGKQQLPPPAIPSASERAQTVWITNNVDYGPILESGSSDQASRGVVKPTITAVKRKIPAIVHQESRR